MRIPFNGVEDETGLYFNCECGTTLLQKQPEEQQDEEPNPSYDPPEPMSPIEVWERTNEHSPYL